MLHIQMKEIQMKIRKMILNHIEALPFKEPFTASSLHHVGSPATIRQNMHRLAQEGKIARVSRGIYARVVYSEPLKKSLPAVGIPEVLNEIEKNTGEKIAMHGAEAIRHLQLSTQMQMKPVYYTTGRSRTINIRNTSIQLRHISPKKLVNHGSIEEIVILALWSLGKRHVTEQTLHHIERVISYENFKKVQACTAHMPAWMASAFFQYQYKKVA
jgi:hypothetical protein